jgi:hypothetical protein
MLQNQSTRRAQRAAAETPILRQGDVGGEPELRLSPLALHMDMSRSSSLEKKKNRSPAFLKIVGLIKSPSLGRRPRVYERAAADAELSIEIALSKARPSSNDSAIHVYRERRGNCQRGRPARVS